MKRTTILIIVFLLLIGLAIAAPTLSRLIPKTDYEKVFTAEEKQWPVIIKFNYIIQYEDGKDIISTNFSL